MDFTLSTEQQALADSVARFCSRDYGFAEREALIRSARGFDLAHWSTFAELGWTGAGLAEEVGGYGGGPVENMIIMEGFGRALVLEPFVSSAVLSLQTLAALPASDARDTLVARVVGGETLLSLGHGEAAGRGDPGIVETRVEGDRLHGAKSLVLGAASADRLLISARGEGGIGLYLVDPTSAGLTMTPYRLLDNHRAADILLDGVVVEHVLAEPGEAEGAIGTGHAHGVIAICSEAVGAMDAAILLTRDYLKTRKQFGVTLNTFQALQHRMADMLVELELSRSIVYQAIASLDADVAQRDRAVSVMKAVVSAAALFVGRNAVQLHGGIGMTEEYAIGHFYRRLFVIASLFGNEAQHLKRMAANPAPFWPALAVTQAA